MWSADGGDAPRKKPLLPPKPLTFQARAAMLKGPGKGGLKRGVKPKRFVHFGTLADGTPDVR